MQNVPPKSRPSCMDEVANAICFGQQFAFASPATFLHKKLTEPPSAASVPSLDSAIMDFEEEPEAQNVHASTASQGYVYRLLLLPTSYLGMLIDKV